MKSALLLPLLRDGDCIGVLALTRRQAIAFRDTEIELATSLVDQAVIAIENVRLWNETQEALERQTATAEVLQVISGSVADASPVFDKILDSCQHLLPPSSSASSWSRTTAWCTRMPGAGDALAASRAHFRSRAAGHHDGRAIRERPYDPHSRFRRDGEHAPAAVQAMTDLIGSYSVAWAPMLWEDRGVGSVSRVARSHRRRSRDKELALLKTFADQAVIAIQNARLFNETQEALASQSATADVLRVISNSPTDVQPVFDAIVCTASKLIDCEAVGLLRNDATHFYPVANASARPARRHPWSGARVHCR